MGGALVDRRETLDVRARGSEGDCTGTGGRWVEWGAGGAHRDNMSLTVESRARFARSGLGARLRSKTSDQVGVCCCRGRKVKGKRNVIRVQRSTKRNAGCVQTHDSLYLTLVHHRQASSHAAPASGHRSEEVLNKAGLKAGGGSQVDAPSPSQCLHLPECLGPTFDPSTGSASQKWVSSDQMFEYANDWSSHSPCGLPRSSKSRFQCCRSGQGQLRSTSLSNVEVDAAV